MLRLKLSSLTRAPLLAVLVLAACGESAQQDSELSSADSGFDLAAAGAGEARSDGVLERLYDGVTWIFQCPTEPMPVPPAGGNSLVLVDAGPHPYLRQRLVDVPVTVKGKICPTERMNRDGIFVIDVSGSMATEDPLKPIDPADPQGPKTCGRLDALNAILDRLPAGTANFGIVTFDTSVIKSSSRLFSDKTALIADITNNGAVGIVNVACANGGGTSYAAGLRRAKELFLASRQYATKEIYFLSDGAPSDTSAAVALANELKNVGIPINGQNKTATIATVMLGTANDSVLRTQIASLDVAGAPIHAVAANAGDLARILDGLADNHLEGSHLQHGGTGAAPTTVDIMQYLNPTTREFTLPTMNLNIDLMQPAYELHFEYWDSHRNRFTIIGKLNWQDRP